MHSKELIEIVKKECASGASYGIIAQEQFQKKEKKQGRQPIIIKRESMQIKRCVEKLIDTKNKVTSTKILRELKINACTRTIQRHIKQLEYYYDKCSQTIFLTAYHKRERIKICKQWLKDRVNWNEVVFTDEKRFNLDGPNN